VWGGGGGGMLGQSGPGVLGVFAHKQEDEQHLADDIVEVLAHHVHVHVQQQQRQHKPALLLPLGRGQRAARPARPRPPPTAIARCRESCVRLLQYGWLCGRSWYV
jgi:hypothetical protein